MTVLAEITRKLAARADLTQAEAAAAVVALLDGTVADDPKAEFLAALAQKGETAEEIAVFAQELRARATPAQTRRFPPRFRLSARARQETQLLGHRPPSRREAPRQPRRLLPVSNRRARPAFW